MSHALFDLQSFERVDVAGRSCAAVAIWDIDLLLLARSARAEPVLPNQPNPTTRDDYGFGLLFQAAPDRHAKSAKRKVR
jgi:hypothetical protein